MIMKYEVNPFNNKNDKNNNTIKGDELQLDTNFPTSCSKAHRSMEKTFCEGYLYVQNRSFWRFPKHVWKRQYFTLKNDFLYISECKSDNLYDYEKSTCIRIGLDTGIYPRDNINGNPKYYIRITTGKQSYTLRSMEESDRNGWMTGLLTSMSNTLMGTYKDR